AVGSVVCQIAKAMDGTVIGSAGTDKKCEWLKAVAHADTAINYRTTPNLTRALGEAAPKGIDVYFDNVGGAHLQAALNGLKTFGRIAACGMISQYNAAGPVAAPANLIYVVTKRLRMEGFIVLDHFDLLPAFQKDMAGWIREGKMKWEETIVDGLENAPKAFL